VRATLRPSDAELEHELLRLTDHFTDELFALEASLARPLVFPVSRLVVDPERFSDDAEEPMAAHGMGAVYTRTLSGAPLRGALSRPERETLIAQFYHPHHTQLLAIVDEALATHGCALVLDCHSYPRAPFPFERKDRARPEVCIGTDDFHTPVWLADTAEDLLAAAGFEVRRNTPFSGALVPRRHQVSTPAVHALMIEVRRDLYIDEETGAKLPGFEILRRRLTEALGALIVHVADRHAIDKGVRE
jgi:N-formylglutamate amidohydrolase